MKTHHHLTQNILSVLVLAILLLVGCSGESLTGAIEPSEHVTNVYAASKQVQNPIDVSGSWTWSRVEKLSFPAWVAQQIIGIQPEGPTTHARCDGSGTMTLIQTDAAFTGTFIQTAQECVTTGGQVFQDPLSFVPESIENGQIRGRNIRLRIDGVVVDCNYHAVIDIQADMAVSLNGGGTCIVPGHPKSEVPMDPPPGGTSKTLSWTAQRP